MNTNHSPAIPLHTTPPPPVFSTRAARRTFLKTLGAAALGAALRPVRAGIAGSGNNPVIGEGEHQYEVIHDWGQLPASHAYGNTHGVCVDASGFVYIKHTVGRGATCTDAIVVFDAGGRFVRSFGSEFKGGAHGLHLFRQGGEDFLYLCDPNRHLVVRTTLDGREIHRLDFPEPSDSYLKPGEYKPTNVATAPDGTVFVADGYGKSLIHRYAADGTYLGFFGGAGAGDLSCPHGLMIDPRGTEPRLVVADRGHRRLQYFTLEGHPLESVTAELRAPCHFDARGDLLLIPDLESRITLFDRQNQLICHLGDGGHYNGVRELTRDHFTPGKFVAPHSACFDHDGNIFVVEWVEVGRVTKLRRLA